MASTSPPETIHTLTPTNPSYPPLLKEIRHPPNPLYIRGNLNCVKHNKWLAVVGSRRANTYGRQSIKMLLPDIVSSGIYIVSGLAHGIDSLSHQVCVNRQLPTIAVLGSGVDSPSIYPASNASLAENIIKHGGALISEYPPGTKALLHHFPARNRIIAGICPATLVIQAAARSGSLITARFALESNREVLAVPGPISDPLSEGTNKLIQEGATPVLEPQDIAGLYSINLDHAPLENSPPLTNEQKKIIEQLNHEPTHVDMVIATLQLPPQVITACLLELELAGYIENAGGMRYIRKK